MAASMPVSPEGSMSFSAPDLMNSATSATRPIAKTKFHIAPSPIPAATLAARADEDEYARAD